MNIKTTCGCGVKENVASLDAIKQGALGCPTCGDKVKVEVQDFSLRAEKKVTK